MKMPTIIWNNYSRYLIAHGFTDEQIEVLGAIVITKMKTIEVKCTHCGKSKEIPTAWYNRSSRNGMQFFCGKICFGLNRRKHKTIEQKKEEKRLYDIEYREKNRKRKQETNRAWFQRTYDPVKAAIERKKKMPRHVEYCRQPKYVAYKKKYDRKYRAKKQYGEFWESKLLMLDIDNELKTQATKYELASQKGTLNKCQKRRRDYESTHSNKS